VAAEAALKDERYIEQTRELNKQGLQQLMSGFEALGLSYIPSVGNFVSVNVGDNAQGVYRRLLEAGVIVRPIGAYNMPHHLRVSVGLHSENKKCLDALKKVLHDV
jgi:histidinol-phosphate aminotransferase